jgi:hypothetical protein
VTAARRINIGDLPRRECHEAVTFGRDASRRSQTHVDADRQVTPLGGHPEASTDAPNRLPKLNTRVQLKQEGWGETPYAVIAGLEQPSAFSLSGDDNEGSVRNPSAVASSAAYQSQRRQHADQQILNTTNGVDGNKRPTGLVRIEYTNGTDFRPAKRLPVEHIVHFDTW